MDVDVCAGPCIQMCTYEKVSVSCRRRYHNFVISTLSSKLRNIARNVVYVNAYLKPAKTNWQYIDEFL